MNSQKIRSFLSTYGAWTLALLGFSTILRLFEHFNLSQQVAIPAGFQTLCIGLWNDLLFTLSFSFFLAIPVFLLWQWKPKVAQLLFAIASLLFILIQAGLVRYYLTTKTLLGADLFGYSMADIKTTVTSSASFSISDLLPVALLILFFLALWLIRKRSLGLNVILSTVLLIVGLLGTFFYNKAHGREGTTADYLSLNKSAYFLTANLEAKTSYSGKTFSFSNYPLLHADQSADALTPYFNLTAAKPNIVFLIIEGLGRDFTGPNAQYGGFTPYLDSLAQHSLYWTNFLSTAGRSFEGLPSILGSLPYGKNGFSEMGQNMPDHLSIVSLLKNNGYRTSFFYGGNANFDYQDVFLEKQGIDYILDENKFGTGYNRNFGSKYSWGYADGDLYKRSLEVMPAQRDQPLLNIYFTLSTHEPFAVPNEDGYLKLVNDRLTKLPDASKYASYKEVFKGLYYSDESIRSFMQAYSRRPDYSNTIFIITGDHRLIPVQEQNLASRFHVPLLIYSPMLKKPASFSALSSHLDIVPSLVQLLRHHTDLRFPSNVHWMGKGLDTGKTFNPAYEMPFMRNKSVMEDYIEGDAFLSGNQLFRIKDNLVLEPLSNTTIKERLQSKLDSFQQLNSYISSGDHLYKAAGAALTTKTVTDTFTTAEQTLLEELSGGNTLADSLFMRARKLAFAKELVGARLLCRKILAESPNYHDVRVLYGRTHAWDKKYNIAKGSFQEVIRRDPTFEDAYLAWTDVELWSGKRDSALLVVNKGLQALPNSEELKLRKAKVLAAKK
ncbi:MAG: sulfatase [Flaviaesturariibacter sp.]|nr:sulfatase [Flaviaesturariibacter sp.]